VSDSKASVIAALFVLTVLTVPELWGPGVVVFSIFFTLGYWTNFVILWRVQRAVRRDSRGR
jgi:hypothetical protein